MRKVSYFKSHSVPGYGDIEWRFINSSWSYRLATFCHHIIEPEITFRMGDLWIEERKNVGHCCLAIRKVLVIDNSVLI